MMKAIRITVLMGFLFTLALPLKAQNIRLSFQIIDQVKLQTVYLSDLDLLQQGLEGTGEPIFELIVEAPGYDPSNLTEIYSDCHMWLALRKDSDLLASWESNDFDIPESLSPYHISNDMLIANNYSFDPTNPDTRVHINETEVSNNLDDLQTDILASGKLPIGSYTIEVNLTYIDPQSEQQVSENRTFTFITATNPSYVQVISPGTPAGSGYASTLYNEFPVFQWTGNGEEYQVLVFEKRNQNQTIDDVINSRENWKSDIEPVQSMVYPQAGDAIPLEYDKTYYWMVKMFINTSSGREEINSEVYQFTLIDPANQGSQQAALSKNDIMAFLRDILGDRADEIAKSLDDYQVSTIRVNGTEITIQELYNLLNTYRSNKVEVYDLILPGTLN